MILMILMINMINFAQVGLPTNAVDMVLDFIDTLFTNLVGVLLLAFLELIWNIFIDIFIELAPVWGLSLVIFAWSYFFYNKFVAPSS